MGSRVSRLDRARMHHPNTRIERTLIANSSQKEPRRWLNVFIIVCYSVRIVLRLVGMRFECGIVADNSLVDAGITSIKGTLVY